jgi:S1-C subfamily serine protease
MIITASGVVLTNNHVIDGSTEVTAQVDGKGPTYPAAVLGTDAKSDVALLQIKGGSNFKTVVFGDSAAIRVGDPVVAIGNALGLSGPETVTNGIISATGRSITVGDPSSNLTENLKDMFQSSAAINPGNSGGPLVDSSGDVIGMNTAEETGSGSGQSASNVGFAIPINGAANIARQIQAGKASATVQIGPHAIMGVEVTSVKCAEGGDGCNALSSSPFSFPFGGSNYTAPVNQGAVVAGVERGDPAQTAGLSAGDVITSVNGSPINSPNDLTRYMNFQRVGEKATVRWVDPNGRHRSATLNLVQGPNV